jgi:hypothetical protein
MPCIERPNVPTDYLLGTAARAISRRANPPFSTLFRGLTA